MFKKLIPYIAKHWKYFAGAVLLLFISNQLSVFVPLISKEIIDKCIIGGQLELMPKLVLLSVGLTAISAGIGAVRRYISALFSQKIVYDLRVDSFKAVQRQSYTFFSRVPIGQLISRITSDTDVVSRFLTWPLTNLLNAYILAVLAFSAMLSLNVKLTLMVIPFFLVVIVLFYRYSLLIRPLFMKIRNQYGALTSVVNNSLVGIITIKALGVEDHSIKDFSTENKQYFELNIKAAKIRATYIPAISFVVGVATVSIIYFGGLGVMNREFTIGSLMAFISYLTMLVWPLRFIGMFITAFQRAMTAAKRVFDLIEAVPEVTEKPGAIPMPLIKGHIVFENVYFGFDRSKPILKNINLEIRPGEKVAIVGPTGSGKSLLVMMIPRFFDPTGGRVLIDGIDVKDVRLKSLRKQIAIVPQEPYIFAGTIRENIAFGKPNASMKEIVHAAKVARIHDFIEKLPKKYETLVGERGITLSGGQKQRIAIARVILVNPRVLILDDPTSNLDAETEKEFIEMLKDVIRDKTTIIITTRPALLKLADRIVVLSNGEIVEEGTHEELIKKKGLYYKLYEDMVKSLELAEARVG
ncbi:MAG: ABC transporter ATP-binding protein [Thermoprotei archaeon]|nr:MAG: ABC transporter ATP-binding protein [Thermoprotei archaeon]RLF00802.1 MAG: ABC transporter ATP-binding protein [Thermoprotei archaeon]HDI74647.1 ABC transporter ATP-binding protein [Thermoprotei archaeon]